MLDSVDGAFRTRAPTNFVATKTALVQCSSDAMDICVGGRLAKVLKCYPYQLPYLLPSHYIADMASLPSIKRQCTRQLGCSISVVECMQILVVQPCSPIRMRASHSIQQRWPMANEASLTVHPVHCRCGTLFRVKQG